MKNLITIILLMLTSLGAKTQIDLSCDASFIGVYPTVEVSYPLYDKFIVGGSYGYNITNLDLSNRIGMTAGMKFDEWVQVEFDFGLLNVTPFGLQRLYSLPPDRVQEYTKKIMFRKFVPYSSIGIKGNFCNNLFFSLKVAYPGFLELGFGVRLRPYKQLSVWDKQY